MTESKREQPWRSPPDLEGPEADLPMLSGDVAIIGMACLFPGAPDLNAYWQNILGKRDAVTDPPPQLMDMALAYDADSHGSETDRIYCQRGGYLGPLAYFDPLEYKIPPMAVGGEPDQWLALKLACDALADAGYSEPDEQVRLRTGVIIGKGTYLNAGNLNMAQHGLIINQTLEVLKSLNPGMSHEDIEEFRQALKSSLPPISSEKVAGLIPNIIVGRIANHLDLQGPTYTVDAACASSLIAIQMAMRELVTDECDLALVGGSQITTMMPLLNAFCQMGALSRRQQIRPFDKDADGTILGEGIGMVVLKRLADAERDGDRIYAAIKGVGVASDGRGVSVMAPRLEGEVIALQRAYSAAGISPESVGLIEAHGTATPVGDVVEIQALSNVFGARQGQLPSCAIGSVKSMISHTMPAAGIAGVIKTALALHHKVLPPTLNCDEPNPKLGLETSPFYINTETRPWIHGSATPRRAGVNSFGFGGINAHVVMEEHCSSVTSRCDSAFDAHRSEQLPAEPIRDLPNHLPAWESEVFILEGSSAAELVSRASELVQFVETHVEEELSGDSYSPAPIRSRVTPADLAFTLNRQTGKSGGDHQVRLAVVAGSLSDLRDKLIRAVKRLEDPGCRQIKDRSGIYYSAEPLSRSGKVAFLFPGEGSQYPNMLADLCLHFPEIRACFDQMDRIFNDHPRGYVPGDYIFPRSTFSADDTSWAEERIWDMDGALEAVLTANHAMATLLSNLHIEPDIVVGHSTGEYSAMRAAGVLELDTDEQFAQFAKSLNQNFESEKVRDGVPRAGLLAIGADRLRVESIADEVGDGVFLAMDNCPHQAVLVGDVSYVERARTLVNEAGLVSEFLAFDRPYHTELFGPYADHLHQVFADTTIRPPRVPIYSSATAAPYPSDPVQVRELIVDQWAKPVEFLQTIEQLYEDGVRIFVEVGPRSNLTSFVEDILRGRSFLAAPANVHRRGGIEQLNHLLAMLAVHGVTMDLDYLYLRRDTKLVDLDSDQPAGGQHRVSSMIKLATEFPYMQLPESAAAKFNRELEASSNVDPASSDANGSASATPISEALPEALDPTQSSRHLTEAPPPESDSSVTWDLGDLGEAPPESGNAPDSAVMQGFLHSMEEFLAVQDEIMQLYFGQSPAPAHSSRGENGTDPGSSLSTDDRSAPFAAQPAENPRAPVERVSTPGTVFSESGRDSGRNFDSPSEQKGTMEGSSPVDAPDLYTWSQQFASALLELVSERTGYPVEMLDTMLDLEADLGIDSIKRVEILGALRQRFDGLQGIDLDELAAKRTLHQIVDLVTSPDQKPIPTVRGGANGSFVAQPEARVPERVPEAPARPAGSRYPLLGEIVRQTPDEIVAERTFDPSEDLYLCDHTLGRDISATDPDLLAFAMMPLTMSLEILAEAAAALSPGRQIIGLRDVYASRWIAFEGDPQRLQVTARLSSTDLDRAVVQLRNLTEDASSDTVNSVPVIQVEVVFGEEYPSSGSMPLLQLEDSQPSRWSDDELYREAMFHGPCWQGVEHLLAKSSNGVAARLRVLPFRGFFRSQPDPEFVLDPVVLDAAGQVVGFWTMEQLETDKLIFPFRLDALDIFGSQRPVGEELACTAFIDLVGQKQVRSDIDIVDASGQLWIRLTGWEDKRFTPPENLYPVILAPRDTDVSEEYQQFIGDFTEPTRFSCRGTSTSIVADSNLWKRVWAGCVLSRVERESYGQLRTPESRKLAWLAGRTAAKDAVRSLLRTHYALDLAPADIEVTPDERGRPIARGKWQESIPDTPVVSISHAGGWAFAVAGLAALSSQFLVDGELLLGIDVEQIRKRPEGFGELAFSDHERELVNATPVELQEEWMLRCWCAKEAISKALGYGLIEGPGSVVIESIEITSGRVHLRLTGKLELAFPELADMALVANTNRHRDMVVATTICERGHHRYGNT